MIFIKTTLIFFLTLRRSTFYMSKWCLWHTAWLTLTLSPLTNGRGVAPSVKCVFEPRPSRLLLHLREGLTGMYMTKKPRKYSLTSHLSASPSLIAARFSAFTSRFRHYSIFLLKQVENMNCRTWTGVFGSYLKIFLPCLEPEL